MMKLKMRLCILAFLLVPILGLASTCSEQSNISREGLDMVQALNDTRDIRVSKELSVGVVERVYYVAKDQVGNAFCIISKHSDGSWERDLETYKLLPKEITETPFIDYDNDQRVYITYYPSNKENTSIFLYSFTLLFENNDWYVESVSYGDFDHETQVFKVSVVNLATSVTSKYSFDQATEQILSSDEIPNHLKTIKARDFSLQDFNQSVGLGVDRK